MYKYGKRSKEKISQCHRDWRIIMNEAIKYMDIAVYTGRRKKAAQNRAFNAGKSKLKWPFSKHNKKPSMALDCAPWPIEWQDKTHFAYMAGLIRGIALRLYKEKKISHIVRWGADWDSDGNIKDHKFQDYPHFELKKPVRRRRR